MKLEEEEERGRDETAAQVCRNEIHRAAILNFRITVTFATAENYLGKRNFGNVCNNGGLCSQRAFARPLFTSSEETSNGGDRNWLGARYRLLPVYRATLPPGLRAIIFESRRKSVSRVAARAASLPLLLRFITP